MIRPEGQPILTAAATTVAESAGGVDTFALMTQAGEHVAEIVWRLAAGRETLILCGPGNNGGDGYVAASALRRAGLPVRVAASTAPRTDAARQARAAWDGAVEPFAAADAAPVIVDALFGTGLSRAPEPAVLAKLKALFGAAQLVVAVDLPSHVAADTAMLLAGDVPAADVTLALGALKPAHVLMPAAAACGAVRIVALPLGDVDGSVRTIVPPRFVHPLPEDHKYSRGLVVVVGGAMAGAASLAAVAAARAGAGYVRLLGEGANLHHAIVHEAWSADALSGALSGKRNAVVLVGPGLGRDEAARERLAAAIASGVRLVIDGDALHLLDAAAFRAFGARPPGDVILTPHAGEFDALFGETVGNKIERTRAAARRAGATVVFKGPDTVVATPQGEVHVATAGDRWLSTAGTGDVLAGTIAAAVVNGAAPDAAAAGVWMHADAARRIGGSFIADDLAAALSAVRAAL